MPNQLQEATAALGQQMAQDQMQGYNPFATAAKSAREMYAYDPMEYHPMLDPTGEKRRAMEAEQPAEQEDSLTLEQAEEIFRKTFGIERPTKYEQFLEWKDETLKSVGLKERSTFEKGLKMLENTYDEARDVVEEFNSEYDPLGKMNQVADKVGDYAKEAGPKVKKFGQELMEDAEYLKGTARDQYYQEKAELEDVAKEKFEAGKKKTKYFLQKLFD